MADLDDVRREALHDWLAERPPPELPDPCEYEEDEPSMGGMHVSRALDVLARAALTPAPGRDEGEAGG